MYLKRVEIIGFKSFAEKTVLNLERGMTAVVGPNGCGKSNTSDAIRWVLGEQNARNLRGGTMQDVIFSGTDSHKALNMAEVNLTLTECEGVLNTEYSEVTITRRVFRTGESQYLINKTPCRLKDIQRLFMDTGVGRGSYAIMEQGKIDQILSSHPEDRRAVFEEASGITKFRTDKKEAMRKLEQTEANLLRLDDIIREVKRQIISLQRQAGKAKRYQQLMQELRGNDIFVTRHKVQELDKQVEQMGNQIASLSEQLEAHREDIGKQEQIATENRVKLERVDHEIGQSMENVSRLRNQVSATQNLIQVNQDRIRELQAVATRDSRDAEEARTRLEEHKASLVSLEQQLVDGKAKLEQAGKAHAEKQARYQELDRQTQAARVELNQLRNKTMELENRTARLQNELNELDSRRQATVIRKERLAAEKIELGNAGETLEKRVAALKERHAQMQAAVAEKSALLNEVIAAKGDHGRKVQEKRQQLNQLNQRAAARRASIELLSGKQAREEGFPGGARLLIDESRKVDGIDRTRIYGALAEVVVADPGYQTALESALRIWLDAVVVTDTATAAKLMDVLAAQRAGPARLLTLETVPMFECPPIGDPLVHHVRTTKEAQNLILRLLATTVVVDSFEGLPNPLPVEAVVVRKDGAIVRGDGSAEFWMVEGKNNNPLARQALKTEAEDDLKVIEKETGALHQALEALVGEEQTLDQRIAELREGVNTSRQNVGLAEGELRMVAREQTQAADRGRTVTAELDALMKQEEAADARRAQQAQGLEASRAELAANREKSGELSKKLEEVEAQRQEASNAAAEQRIALSENQQQVANLDRQAAAARDRIKELGKVIEERAKGISTYEQRVAELGKQAEAATESIAPLENARKEAEAELEAIRARRQEYQAALNEAETQLRGKRATADSLSEQKGKLDVKLAETRMGRQNMLDRVLGEYKLDISEFDKEPEPKWEIPEGGEKPTLDAIETHVAELRAKIESIGPVNLVAIEEHQELEDRHQFLTKQQSDLVTAKQQLVDLLKKINSTTTELFTETFNKVNANFEVMFTKLFGGGTAKLVLVNEDDILESGIEIIARPPGKKLQNISLLSGGERTMTAVALLFSLFMVKPSPFCVLDEMDAALDEANIGRFVEALKEFLKTSQFIVITHNQKTMAAADVLYGVTMEQKGVSKLVSVKFNGERPADRPENAPRKANEFAAAR